MRRRSESIWKGKERKRKGKRVESGRNWTLSRHDMKSSEIKKGHGLARGEGGCSGCPGGPRWLQKGTGRALLRDEFIQISFDD